MIRILRPLLGKKPLVAAIDLHKLRLCAFACLPLSVTLSSCWECHSIECSTGLTVSLGMTNGDALPSGLYQLQVSDNSYTAVGECQLPTTAGCTQTSETPTTLDGKRIAFSFLGDSSMGNTITFTLLVDGATRKSGSLSVNYQLYQSNCPGLNCGTGSAAVNLP